MSFLAKSKASLGNAIMKGQLTPTTSTSFDTTQNELWTGQVTAVASQITSLGITCFTTSQAVSQDVSSGDFIVPYQPGDQQIFNQPWVTTQADTAMALVAQINAAAATIGNPLYQLVTAATSSGGGYTITTTQPYLTLQFNNNVYTTISKTLSSFDLATYQGDAWVYASVSSNPITYNELGMAAVAGQGPQVVADSLFDIVGVQNILNFRCINTSGASTVNYEIYVG